VGDGVVLPLSSRTLVKRGGRDQFPHTPLNAVAVVPPLSTSSLCVAQVDPAVATAAAFDKPQTLCSSKVSF